MALHNQKHSDRTFRSGIGPRTLRCAMALLVAAPAALVTASAALAQDGDFDPKLASSAVAAAHGEQVIITGTGWPPETSVQVELCGNNGLNGTSDCDQRNSVDADIDPDGAFSTALMVDNPPVPCPCVFTATSDSTDLSRSVDVDLARSAIAGEEEPLETAAAPTSQLAVVNARVEGTGPWTSWFGARPERTLVFTVLNTGQEPIDDPAVTLVFGRGADPTGFVEPPEIGHLEPGEGITVRTELTVPYFAIGTYGVEGSIAGFDVPVEFRAESSHVPWALLLLPLLILVQLALVWLRNRVRRFIHRRRDKKKPVELEPEARELAARPVIDLRDGQEHDDDSVDGDSVDGDSVDGDSVEGDTADGDTDEGEPSELEEIISDELEVAFGETFEHRSPDISDADLRSLILELTSTVSGRVAARTELTRPERDELEIEISDAMLTSFGLGTNSTT